MLQILRTFLFALIMALSMTQVSATAMVQTVNCVSLNQVCHTSIQADTANHDLVCANDLSCVMQCAVCGALPLAINTKLPECLVDQYSLVFLSAATSFFSQPNIPPPKSIYFS